MDKKKFTGWDPTKESGNEYIIRNKLNKDEKEYQFIKEVEGLSRLLEENSKAFLDMSLEEQKVYIENRDAMLQAWGQRSKKIKIDLLRKELADIKKSLEILQQKQEK
jgi:hypothetical protein